MSPNSSTNKDAASKPTKENLNTIAPSPTEEDIVKNEGGDKKTEVEGEDGKKHVTLRQKALQKLESNPSQLGDPISLKAETADSEPTEQDRGAASSSGSGKSKL